MAFIPDEAVFRMREISPPAFQLYVYFCAKRNHKTGGYLIPLSLAVKETAMNKGQIYKLEKQLIEAGWIAVENGFVRPLVGQFLKSPEVAHSNPEVAHSNPEVAHSNPEVAHSNPKGCPQQPHIRNTSHVPAMTSHVTSHDQPKRKQRDALAVSPADVVEVFLYWQVKLDHPSAKLTGGRKAKVEARRRAGYTVEQIKRAIDGCAASPFHCGLDDYGNKTGAVYDDLELICRDDTKLEKFIAIADRVPALAANSNGRASPAVTTPLIEHNRAAVEQAKREMREFQEKQNANG